MHIQTHILSGWCFGNLVPHFTARERLFCMLAAGLADLDGLSIVAGQEAYWDYHHTLGHNLAFGMALCLALAVLSKSRGVAFTVYLSLFHLHLLLDYYGSGPGWGIPYFWPFARRQWAKQDAWPFYSWQNITTAFAFVGWTVWIVRRRGRTPLEGMMPGLDRKLAAMLRPGSSRQTAVASATGETVALSPLVTVRPPPLPSEPLPRSS